MKRLEIPPGEKKDVFPALPLEEWKETKNTLHLYAQIIGKIRLALCPPVNHWWHVPLYVSTHGLTTRAIPYGFGNFEIEMDLLEHELLIKTSGGEKYSFALHDGLSVAEFYSKIITGLSSIGINADILALPYGIPFTEPFSSDTSHSSYNKLYIDRFRKILTGINGIFEEFRGWFNGKSTPVHLFWHSFDLALTRFSGKPSPVNEGMGMVDREAYSHEVISFGFWAGDDNIPAPAFYSYTYPQPEGLTKQPLKPDAAYWGELRGGAMAFLMYDEVRKAETPKKAVLDFLESAYEAGAKTAGWDMEKFNSSFFNKK